MSRYYMAPMDTRRRLPGRDHAVYERDRLNYRGEPFLIAPNLSETEARRWAREMNERDARIRPAARALPVVDYDALYPPEVKP